MRQRFAAYCEQNLHDFEIFFPEHAMPSYFSDDVQEPFDIADFEEVIGNLSHAIVIFPEAAGSYAETGYFSAIDVLASRTILALNTNYQNHDSFISLGPARKIGIRSKFHPVIQIDYNNPKFEDITKRLKRVATQSYKKSFDIREFSALSSYELFSLIHIIVDFLGIATIPDILYMLRSIFGGKISPSRSRQICSILVGAKYLKEFGDYGHLARTSKPGLMTVKVGHKSTEAELKLQLAALYQRADQEFVNILESSQV
jgi:hypothetical protein